MNYYKKLLDTALNNLYQPHCVTRIQPTQSVQALHFQTFKMTDAQYKEYKATGHSKTVYALDFIVKYKPENMHDNGHYLCIMFQGEKVFEKKRKGLLDVGFKRVLKDFETTYKLINEYHAHKKRELLASIIGG